jgi:uncharacterized membrane protein
MLEKFENDSMKIVSNVAVGSIVELKDFYVHQQDTQAILVEEIKYLDQEKEQKKNKIKYLKELLSELQLMKKGKNFLNS